jgi:hypothetical protein
MVSKFKIKVREVTPDAQKLTKALEEATAPDKLPERKFEMKVTLEADYDTIQKAVKQIQEIGKASVAKK